MTVAVLGANGVYGRHLTPRLVTAGFRVRAIVRRPEAAGVARACSAGPRATRTTARAWCAMFNDSVYG